MEAESESESSEEWSSDTPSWTERFARRQESRFMSLVDYEFISDSFGLFGLSALFPDYTNMRRIILDEAEAPFEYSGTDSDMEEDVEATALVNLYGLIHARFIVTTRGLEAMRKKYESAEFGTCPRLLCEKQAVLPIGLHDSLGQSTVKVYCPRCKDIYSPSRLCPSRSTPIPSPPPRPVLDGAFFGTTFPHLLLLTYTNLIVRSPVFVHTPRIYGFDIHRSSRAYRRGRFLREEEDDECEEERENHEEDPKKDARA